jgi:hypothetical protein
MEQTMLNLFDLKKMPAQLFCVVWLCSCACLFIPPGFLQELHLLGFKQACDKYIAITFIAGSCFMVVALVSTLLTSARNKTLHKQREIKIIRAIIRLNDREKAVLREFFIQGRNTLDIPSTDKTLAGLVNNHILQRVSSQGVVYLHGTHFAYSMTAFAAEILSPLAIDLPEEPGTGEKNWVLNNRPDWAKNKELVEAFRSVRMV